MVPPSKNQGVVDFNWEKTLDDAALPPDLEVVPGGGQAAPAEPAAEGKKEKPPNLDLLLDIPLEISAELGRTRMIINDLLQLGQGSVIELNKLAGEPLEILVNQKLIARGEVVVVNEKFGIRLTDIISPLERIKQLG
jgi:flagellar motor switch protein FliN/FliY